MIQLVEWCMLQCLQLCPFKIIFTTENHHVIGMSAILQCVLCCLPNYKVEGMPTVAKNGFI